MMQSESLKKRKGQRKSVGRNPLKSGRAAKGGQLLKRVAKKPPKIRTPPAKDTSQDGQYGWGVREALSQ